ncbi:hypothetical protein [Reinekea sp. G2M2-21]|uniref:hypothetical protein n=1 Tax=Reinekea sp. G2M2-21 TaxID=2788942 RepID=UPI0018AA641D|nr:hypothetical protein [Reinekea sp. G2M2-21]
MKLLKSLFKAKPSIEHNVFGRLILENGKKGPYWIHESYSCDDPTITIDVLSSEPPSEAQVDFYKEIVSDLDQAFDLVRGKLVPEYESVLNAKFPDSWREVLVFAGIGIPCDGKRSSDWDITFELVKDNYGYLFNCYFESGNLIHVGIDT